MGWGEAIYKEETFQASRRFPQLDGLFHRKRGVIHRGSRERQRRMGK
jgi:hypothetical protein